MPDMEIESQKIAQRVRSFSGKRIKVVTHIDADGISAGSAASMGLEGAGIGHEIEFVKQIDEILAKKLIGEKWDLVWFTDLGSGSLSQLSGIPCVITDHHVPEDAAKGGATGNGEEAARGAGRTLESFNIASAPVTTDAVQLNPHFFGISGATEISGAGTTYLVARHLSPGNPRIAQMAIVGAVGDLQDMAEGKLTGLNRRIIDEAKAKGIAECGNDIRFFGRETRPVFKLLQYASDPQIPGISGSEEACVSFLVSLGIPLKEGEQWRRWIDLSSDEKRAVVSAVVKLLLEKGMGHAAARRIVGEVYTFPIEQPGTELHDAKEFATLLNACGRYEKAETGYRVCCGDREEGYKNAQLLLAGHRRNLVESIALVKELGIVRMKNLQYFDAGDKIRDTVVGTVAGMLINSGEVDSSIPVFALSTVSEPERGEGTKISARGTKALVAKGLDLSAVMNICSEAMGGFGGGHNVAAGAFVPKGKEKEFLDMADRMVGGQLAGAGRA